MNKKVNERELLIYYDTLRKSLKDAGVLGYVSAAYYHDKIAERFGISSGHACRVINRIFRKKEQNIIRGY